MKILVSMKQVPDFAASVRIKTDGSGLDTTHIKKIMNPFDEIALEEAVRLKEKGKAQEIVVVSIGPAGVQESLRTALAMGADRGILIQTEGEMYPLMVAKILQTLIIKETPRLVLLGKQAIDTDDNQTGQMLAGLLRWPQGTFSSYLELNEHSVRVTREIDGGLETLLLQLPAVITTDLRLNEPRYISLPNIMRAKHKPLDVIPLDTLTLSLTPGIKILKMTIPEKQRAKVRVSSGAELIRCLKEEAKVL